MAREVTNVVIAGLGGQGVIKASDILAEAAFLAGFDVKKSEIHGMSQRGGSVSSDVRFGKRVLSPMVPTGAADAVLVLAPEEVDVSKRFLHPGGKLITVDDVDAEKLANRKSLNVALLGTLSQFLEIPRECWLTAIHNNLAPKLHEVNDQAFATGCEVSR